MSGVLKLNIQESADELKALLTQQTHVVKRSKLQILWWLKLEKVTQEHLSTAMRQQYQGRIRYWCENGTRVGLFSVQHRKEIFASLVYEEELSSVLMAG